MITRIITVIGMVQGIGYRPYVAKLANKLNINGNVRNSYGDVIINATASKESMEEFCSELEIHPPFGARVDRVTIEQCELEIFDTFTIESSRMDSIGEKNMIPPMIPPDLSTCPDCEKELLDPKNRRYRYPFISCVKCGPRYSIIERLPYDRIRTTMRDFHLCEDCTKEYTGSTDIRRHAQTISCYNCGPQLVFYECKKVMGGTENNVSIVTTRREQAFTNAVKVIKDGGIIAVKDIGGFHLVCSPFIEKTIHNLRVIKGREAKPFAVMFSTIEGITKYCKVSDKEKELLQSNARPIVLVPRIDDTNIADSCIADSRINDLRVDDSNIVKDVYGSSPNIGAMLPCNPLQILLVRDCGPLIMTSANRSGEPIITDNEDMIEWQRDLLEDSRSESAFINGILMNQRRILMPLDDSVMQVIGNRQQMIRRARGFVPDLIHLQFERLESNSRVPDIYAAGGDLKSVMCFLSNDRAYLSQQLGDIASAKMSEWNRMIYEHMKKLFGFDPRVYVCDLHPDYQTVHRTLALANRNGSRVIQIQHHHAHIASVIAEHHLSGKVLGVAFDGTGYGTDHTVWGSEFLLSEDTTFHRLAHLLPVQLIAGEEGAKNADMILMGMLASLGIESPLLKRYFMYCKDQEDYEADYQNNHQTNHESRYQISKLITKNSGISLDKFTVIKAAIDHRINTITSTSMGRLFDAVSALLHICHYNSYEGEAAIELENAAAEYLNHHSNIDVRHMSEQFHLNVVETNHEFVSDTRSLLEQLLQAMCDGEDCGYCAFGFINAVSNYIVETIKLITDKVLNGSTGLQIALSGGTFQNRLLLNRTIYLLEKEGFDVYSNQTVPSGDGGISLGQAYLASLMIRKEIENDDIKY